MTDFPKLKPLRERLAEIEHYSAKNGETLREVLIHGYRALGWKMAEEAADETIEAIEEMVIPQDRPRGWKRG
jgi:hypothetical protein